MRKKFAPSLSFRRTPETGSFIKFPDPGLRQDDELSGQD